MMPIRNVPGNRVALLIHEDDLSIALKIVRLGLSEFTDRFLLNEKKMSDDEIRIHDDLFEWWKEHNAYVQQRKG